jgi:zinc protease
LKKNLLQQATVRALASATLFTVVVLTGGLVTPAHAGEPAAKLQSAAATSQPWGHELTQRAADPAVRFGHLPNGLRYAIQHNETPKDGVAMRMRIGAGSLVERDEEQGLAHFLEHMAFRGSAHVPDGEVVHMLERQGLHFGPDTNAFTAQDQTVYMFNFPRADATALDTGFTLFREIGQHLTLDVQLVEQEKGVVLSEERFRDGPPLRAAQAEYNNALAGTRFSQRWPLGLVATIQAATPERLRRYYQANYRPDNATLIVVGNIDVDTVEHQIRERFADWKSVGQPDAVDMGIAKPAKSAVEFVADGVADTLSLTWVLPPDVRAPTLAVEREQFLLQLGLDVLNARLTDRTLKPGSPFLRAGVGQKRSVFKLAAFAQLSLTAAPTQQHRALDAAIEELRRLLQEGVQDTDMQRLVPATRSYFQAQVAQAATQQNEVIADGLVQAAHEGSLYTSAAQDLAFVEPLLAQVTPQELTNALRSVFDTEVPVVFHAAKADPVGVDVLAQQVTQALTRPLEARGAQTVADWPYTDFGEASAVLSKTTDAELGATTVTFANGTRLVVKSTAQEKDKVNIQVALGQGLAGVPKERLHALWALGWMTMGGTGKRSLAELMQWQQTSGKLVGVGLRVEPYAFVLNGDTRPADLLAQLQVAAAYARDPGFRPELGEKLLGTGPMMINQLEANVVGVYQREMMRVMSNGEPRLGGIPTAADVTATRPEDLPAMLREGLASAADVVIVGDVSVDEAIAATQATFGAGPARRHLPRLPFKLVPAADGGAPHVVTHGGRADQAILGWFWAMPDQWADPALSNTGRIAAAIVQARLIDTVREKLGITYTPSTSGGGSIDVPGQGSFLVLLETPQDKFDAFRAELRAQLRNLADKPVSADELQRAKQPAIESSTKAPQYNGHWGYWLPRILTDARMKGAMLGETAAIRAVTAEQVQAFFRDHIVGREPVEVVAKGR